MSDLVSRKTGLLQRLGFTEKELICVPLSEIKEFCDGKIIVSEGSGEPVNVS